MTYSDEVTEVLVLTDRRYISFFFFCFFKGDAIRREHSSPATKLRRNRGTIRNTYVQYLITTTKPYPNYLGVGYSVSTHLVLQIQ